MKLRESPVRHRVPSQVCRTLKTNFWTERVIGPVDLPFPTQDIKVLDRLRDLLRTLRKKVTGDILNRNTTCTLRNSVISKRKPNMSI